jgi:hypothetical protein
MTRRQQRRGYRAAQELLALGPNLAQMWHKDQR